MRAPAMRRSECWRSGVRAGRSAAAQAAAGPGEARVLGGFGRFRRSGRGRRTSQGQSRVNNACAVCANLFAFAFRAAHCGGHSWELHAAFAL